MDYKNINRDINGIFDRENQTVNKSRDIEVLEQNTYCLESVQRLWRSMMKENVSPLENIMEFPNVPELSPKFFFDFENYFVLNPEDGLNMLIYFLGGTLSNLKRIPFNRIFSILLDNVPNTFQIILQILDTNLDNIIIDFFKTNWEEILIHYNQQKEYQQLISEVLVRIAPFMRILHLEVYDLVFELLSSDDYVIINNILKYLEKLPITLIQNDEIAIYICQNLMLAFDHVTQFENTLEFIFRIIAKTLPISANVDVTPLWEHIPKLLNFPDIESIDAICLFLESMVDLDPQFILEHSDILGLFFDFSQNAPFHIKEKVILVLIDFIRMDIDEITQYFLSVDIVSILLQICASVSESTLYQILDTFSQLIESFNDSEVSELFYEQLKNNYDIIENIATNCTNVFITKYIIQIESFISSYEMQ